MRRTIAAVALLTSACAHRPAFDTYRLRGPLLVPPGVKGPEITERTLVSDIKPGPGNCAAESPLLHVRKKRLVVTASRESLLAPKQPGWLSGWSAQAEADGCVPQGEGLRLANLIASLLPLESHAVYRLLHVNDVQAGYVELGAENRLEVRSPIGEGELHTSAVTGNGAQLTVDLQPAPALTGFEIGWFAVRPNAGRPGYHFEPLSAERTTRNGVEHLSAPSTNFFHFPPQAAFFRLLYKTDDSGVIAMIVSGATREDLEVHTRMSCQQAGQYCTTLPRRIGVNPFLAVMVNGREIAVLLDGTVRSAIQAGGANPDAVLSTLAVSRPYAGLLRAVEFDRSQPAILGLKLAGGEQLTW